MHPRLPKWRTEAGEPKKTRVDLWLQRIAWAAAVILAAVAVFGYFYTVRPIYQKQVLDEQVAQQKVELARLADLSTTLRLDTARVYMDLRSHVGLAFQFVSQACTRGQPPIKEILSCIGTTTDSFTAAHGVLRREDTVPLAKSISAQMPALERSLLDAEARMRSKLKASAIGKQREIEREYEKEVDKLVGDVLGRAVNAFYHDPYPR